jgi:hypothetical protein
MFELINDQWKINYYHNCVDLYVSIINGAKTWNHLELTSCILTFITYSHTHCIVQKQLDSILPLPHLACYDGSASKKKQEE